MAQAGTISLPGPVVVRSPNWLGDAVMALPAIRNLRRFLPPETHLAVAAPEKLAALWDACPFVDEIVELEKPKNIPAVAEMYKEGDYKTAILLPNSLRVAGEALAAGIPNTVAYPGHKRRWLITHLIEPAPYDPHRQHQKHFYLDLISALGAEADASCPEMLIPATFDPIDLPEQPYLVLCPGAEYGPAKRWPAARYAEVARDLQKKRQAQVLIVGAKVDIEIAQEVENAVPDAVNLAGKTSLEQLMRLLAGARVVLSNDSGAMHLASALGTRVVAIFGSTEDKLTGPIGPADRNAIHRYHVPCSPCFLRDCPLDFACMEKVTAEAVAASALDLWDDDSPANNVLLDWPYRRGHFPFHRRSKTIGPRRVISRAA